MTLRGSEASVNLKLEASGNQFMDHALRLCVNPVPDKCVAVKRFWCYG